MLMRGTHVGVLGGRSGRPVLPAFACGPRLRTGRGWQIAANVVFRCGASGTSFLVGRTFPGASALVGDPGLEHCLVVGTGLLVIPEKVRSSPVHVENLKPVGSGGNRGHD